MVLLFVELYGFKNDAEFHRVGFGTCCKYHEWSTRLDELRSQPRAETAKALSETGYVPGDLRTLADDYRDNGGCPQDAFACEVEARMLVLAGAPPSKRCGC